MATARRATRLTQASSVSRDTPARTTARAGVTAKPKTDNRPHYNYPRHAISASFPDLDSYQRQALADTLREDGIRFDIYPIILYRGEIVDGWHRYSIAKGMGYRFEDDDFVSPYDEDDEETARAAVVKAQVQRRSLTATERAAAAIKMLNYAPKQGRAVEGERTVTEQDVARLAGVSGRTVRQAYSIMMGKKSTKITVPAAPVPPILKLHDSLNSLVKRAEALVTEALGSQHEIAAEEQEMYCDILGMEWADIEETYTPEPAAKAARKSTSQQPRRAGR